MAVNHQTSTMASSRESLLSTTPTKRSTNSACKVLLFSLSIAAVISLTAYTALHFTITPAALFSSNLCLTSSNPASCNSIVSESLTDTQNSHPSVHVRVVHDIITRSLRRLDAADRSAGFETQTAAVADCAHLMDLSRHRLLKSISAVTAWDHDDAVSWLSAVLTNHDTCLDGLRETNPGEVPSMLEEEVKKLMDLASAALAVLSSARTATDEISKPVIHFPSWVTFGDRKLLEAKSIDAVQANAVVAKDGSGKFSTVQAAVNASPDNSATRYMIYVKRGTYKEQVTVGGTKKNIMIVGDGIDATIITGSLNVVDGSTTFKSATLISEGDSFILQDITIQNTAGPQKHQAVALRTSSDMTVINRCKLDAFQDTLYTHTLRQFFRDSTITGTVDFIFGNAGVVFQNCNLVARKPMSNQQNLVTAQGRTDPNQNTGTSIQNCQVIPSSDLIPVEGSIPSYLGRPWKEYSRTVYLQSFIDNHIVPKGWLEWSGNFALSTLFYGEYMNKGPGAGTAGRVTWPGYRVITKASDAMPFTVGQLIQGGPWIRAAGVAFTEGL